MPGAISANPWLETPTTRGLLVKALHLKRVARHPKLKHAAFILETPYDDPRADIKNLAMLRSFVESQKSRKRHKS